ncbi:unnamed protein product [Ilex paraguariensis]|uniref:Senescence regulator n=1 Tax=Ilex paraguariensis TaxID=185542 RepID=A0ABC8UEA9_9AQUA
MATRKKTHHHERPNYLYLEGSDHRVNPVTSDSGFELREAEVWDSSEVVDDVASEPKKSIPTSRMKKPLKKISSTDRRPGTAATSLPVNIPDWSQILGGEYKNPKRENEEDDDDEDDRVPPHVYLATTRGSSFSVHEGVGRTLKGRDLSRVRNAIWKQTGFED